MNDPFFDKPPAPSRPLISTGAVVSLSLALMVVSFFGFACIQPEAAITIGKGLGPLITVCILCAAFVVIIFILSRL